MMRGLRGVSGPRQAPLWPKEAAPEREQPELPLEKPAYYRRGPGDGQPDRQKLRETREEVAERLASVYPDAERRAWIYRQLGVR
jgi:hypothetical protein